MLSNRGRSRKHSVSRCIRVRAGSKVPGWAEEPREQPERGRLCSVQVKGNSFHPRPSTYFPVVYRGNRLKAQGFQLSSTEKP